MTSRPHDTSISTSTGQLADLLLDSIVAIDVDTLRERVYAADVVVWHNFDGVEQTRDQNLATLSWLGRHVTNLRYEEICRHLTDTGFVQQHVLRGTTREGVELDVPACVIVTVADGRIARIDEYLDTAQVAALRP